MKKLLITLFLLLFTIPLFSQTVYINDNNRERLMKHFFSVDTIQEDTTYTIQYTLYIDRLVRYIYPFNYKSFYNNWRSPYYNNYWSYNYDWYYPYWYYYDNWYYDNYTYYHRHYWNYPKPYYKPIPRHKNVDKTIRLINIRQREITSTRVSIQNHTRPATNRTEKYTRPRSHNNSELKNVRQAKTYENTRPNNNNRSSYTRTNPNTRTYNRATRSTTVRNTSTQSSSGNSSATRISSGSRSSGRR